MMDFANEVAKLCLSKYDSLKNSGKPRNDEWTVLSGVVLRKPTGELFVVSLSTGTKCLSGAELRDTTSWPPGGRLSDSHAEILTRRAFLRYLYHQVALALNASGSEIFRSTKSSQIEIIDDISFHFFSSQVPCGDCSIIPKSTERPKKIPRLDEGDIKDTEIGTEIEDVHRTGAKCLENEKKQDPRGSGSEYHVLGPLRTKPGRGDRTLSLSCSDKIAKWIVIGVQGALLSLLIPRIRFESVIIGGGCPFSLESMQRGLYKRFQHTLEVPKIYQAVFSFVPVKSSTRTRPCPSSVIWCAVPDRNIEITVEGRKQGATKKRKGSHLLVSRRGLFETFLTVFEKSTAYQPTHPKRITYFDCKRSSREYQELWRTYRANFFCTWPSKPQYLQNFVL